MDAEKDASISEQIQVTFWSHIVRQMFLARVRKGAQNAWHEIGP